jgi:hypothetical protein
VDGCDEMTVDLQGNRDLLSQKLRILYDMIWYDMIWYDDIMRKKILRGT